MIPYDKHREAGFLKSLRQSINQLKAGQRSLRIANGANYHVKRTAIGTVLDIKRGQKGEPAPSKIEIQRFKIENIESRYLDCYKVDEDGDQIEVDTVQVLRPRAMWAIDTDSMVTGYVAGTVTAGDVQSRNYDVTLNVMIGGNQVSKTFKVHEELRPRYTVGNYLLGVKGYFGGYQKPDPQGPASDSIKWIDLNVDARRWQPNLWAVEVCVNNATQYMLVMASDKTT